jgi:hypothetical protein
MLAKGLDVEVKAGETIFLEISSHYHGVKSSLCLIFSYHFDQA